jgi:myo-inositol 2-dehydrogenase/D-chiro-inositol 1-dehydrogenase
VAPDVPSALGHPDVQAVLIASATITHAAYISLAARAGKPILCEKPIDLDLARVRKCRADLAEHPVPVQIGFNRRFDPGHAAIRKAVQSGEIGRLEKLIITSRDPCEPPVDYLRASGGLFRDMMIHDFDMTRFILGEEVVELTAMGSAAPGTAAASIGDLHTAMVTMKSTSGVLCHINCSRHASYGYDQRIEAFGPEGMLISNNVTATNLERYGNDVTSAREPLLHFFIERYQASYQAELRSFIRSVKEGVPPSPSFEDGERALAMADAALESLQTRAMVPLCT